MRLNLYKKINGNLELVDFGFSKFTEVYEKQGYVVQPRTNRSGINKKVDNNFIIHHIHRARFNLRARLNNLFCKLIPSRFLKY